MWSLLGERCQLRRRILAKPPSGSGVRSCLPPNPCAGVGEAILPTLPHLPAIARLVQEVVAHRHGVHAAFRERRFDARPFDVIVRPDVEISLRYPARIEPSPPF